jgi:hypothetical protein
MADARYSVTRGTSAFRNNAWGPHLTKYATLTFDDVNVLPTSGAMFYIYCTKLLHVSAIYTGQLT